MAYSLCPDNGLPRLWRFVGPGILPAGLLCVLDPQQNLLVIDKEAFDRLPAVDQHMVLRTQRRSISYAQAA